MLVRKLVGLACAFPPQVMPESALAKALDAQTGASEDRDRSTFFTRVRSRFMFALDVWQNPNRGYGRSLRAASTPENARLWNNLVTRMVTALKSQAEIILL